MNDRSQFYVLVAVVLAIVVLSINEGRKTWKKTKILQERELLETHRSREIDLLLITNFSGEVYQGFIFGNDLEIVYLRKE
tara:strand:+ start:8782 stop:9021 length:240 start_codon:yes stop_codon:yes gene_type:complete